MNPAAETRSGLLFGEFLSLLRQQGFSIGVDHHLRLQELIERIGGNCAPGDLKTLLCPIFATNRSQQELFYRSFDAYFALFKPDPRSEEEPQATAEAGRETILGHDAGPAEEKPRPRRVRGWIFVIAGIWLAAIVIAGLLLWQPWPGQAPAGGVPGSPDVPPAAESAARTAASRPQPAATSQSSELEPGFFQRYAKFVHITLALAVLMLLFLCWRHRRRRRQLVLQKQRGTKPPYTWPIRIEGVAPGLYEADRLHVVARHMRRRQADEFRHLDVPATVRATIEAMGYPTFCYRAASRQPEYLALIDRASFRDHQARLFDGLMKALEQEGIFITRYFYDGDPRVCSDERGIGIPLAELQNTCRGHRLLLFGEGRQIVDPLTGKLDSWVTDSFEWPERALLTPKSPAQWGWHEINLAGCFVLLPATVEGLFALIDHFDSRTSPDLRDWRRVSPDRILPYLGRDGVLHSLRNYLGEDAFQWLCACAVYPELHWDLTLCLGALPGMSGRLLREENLLRLIRLPWFRSGAIPDEVRLLLIRELSRDQEKAIRASILELLERNPPPAGSCAADSYRLDLVVQHWLFRRDRPSYREMLREMHARGRGRDVRDYTLLQTKDTGKISPLDILLPERLRSRFNGISLGGFRKRLAGVVALLTLRVLSPGILRGLTVGIPAALATVAVLWALNWYWGRATFIAALLLLMALPPIWLIAGLMRKLWATVSENVASRSREESLATVPAPALALALTATTQFARRRWPLVLLCLLLLVTGTLISLEVFQRQRQVDRMTRLAEGVFYQMRVTGAQLVSQRDKMTPEQFDALRNRKVNLEKDYDKFRESLGVSSGQSAVDQEVMRLARRLGETDIEIPAGFKSAVLGAVEKWRSSGRLREAMARAGQSRVLPIIRMELEKSGLPRELLFIALQESGFDSTVVGPATQLGIAKGMWQLLPMTAEEYGLRTGPLKDQAQYDPADQRHDEILSTEAVVRYLAYLYSKKAAGSGLLVVAAYNRSAQRIIDRLDQLPNEPLQRNFWNFYRKGWVPAEIREYVTSIFAAALICENPRVFDFDIEPISSMWAVRSEPEPEPPTPVTPHPPPQSAGIGEEIHRYQVAHRHLFGRCTGTLTLDGSSVSYESSSPAHSFKLPMQSLALTARGGQNLELVTKDQKRSWIFAVEDAIQAAEIQAL